MKRKPSPAIRIEKHLGWAGKLGGAESGDLQGRADSISQVDGVSDMAQPAGSVGLLVKGSEMGQWSAFLCGIKLSPSSCLDVRHFKFYPACHWCLSSCYPRGGAQRE